MKIVLDQSQMTHKLPDATAWRAQDIKRRNRNFLLRFGAGLLAAAFIGAFLFIVVVTGFMPEPQSF